MINKWTLAYDIEISEKNKANFMRQLRSGLLMLFASGWGVFALDLILQMADAVNNRPTKKVLFNVSIPCHIAVQVSFLIAWLIARKRTTALPGLPVMATWACCCIKYEQWVREYSEYYDIAPS
jgi:hypothetical protein